MAGTSRPLGITYDLTSRWMATARTLAAATDAKLILGVGLEANRPRIDAVEASPAVVGHRPPLSRRVRDRQRARAVSGDRPGTASSTASRSPWYSKVGTEVFSRGPAYGPGAFVSDFSRALAALPPGPAAGPVTGLLRWIDAFRPFVSRALAGEDGDLARLRAQPVRDHAHLTPVPERSQSADGPRLPRFVNGISPYVALAHGAGDAFRVDEMNSVTCNGRIGVSNTFASALWVMDALFTLAGDGVDGVNIHTYPDAANGLFDFTPSARTVDGTVHPIYYGLLMFEQAAPAGSRVLRAVAPGAGAVRVRATLAPDHRTRVLLVNDSLSHSALALVHAGRRHAVPGRSSACWLASAYATGGVTLGGASFGAGTTTGVLPPVRTAAVSAHSGAYAVSLPAGQRGAAHAPATGPRPVMSGTA